MYYTGVDPRTMEPVYVAHNPHEKAMQRALIQYKNPKNYDLVYEALVTAHRTDLIGFDKKCLIRPKNKNAPAGTKPKRPLTEAEKKYGISFEKYDSIRQAAQQEKQEKRRPDKGRKPRKK